MSRVSPGDTTRYTPAGPRSTHTTLVQVTLVALIAPIAPTRPIGGPVVECHPAYLSPRLVAFSRTKGLVPTFAASLTVDRQPKEFFFDHLMNLATRSADRPQSALHIAVQMSLLYFRKQVSLQY
ncbi:hypothetical protein K461DRAFT_170304 [Myriangium duriaei CBS 260.36]|uniref:Uncharacterized protein n=1 Tax=Myriangium duriaei CBS 260.36 TaxID=1168546 RepID=A0A9P4J2M8_9PEZI|nr:hypothetical protein K461DRAFT_170304 [Myriangium duriaei CBS 260.36]